MTNRRAALLLHVGLHKTGTTWLQRNVFERRHGHEMEYLGDVGLIYHQMIVPSRRDFDPRLAREAFSRTVDAAAQKGRLAVLSAEGLAGRPFHQKYYRDVITERLAQTYPDAHILLTIREQSKVIGSMYGQYIRFGYSSSLSDFVSYPPNNSGFQAVLDRDFYNYKYLVEDYERFFPSSRITVLPFEQMIAEPVAAISRLAAETGWPLSPLDAADVTRPANPAWSDLAYGAARLTNRLIAQDSRWRRPRGLINPNAIGHRVDRLTPGLVRRRMRRATERLIDDALGDYYAESNVAASERIGVDLGRLGYRVPG